MRSRGGGAVETSFESRAALPFVLAVVVAWLALAALDGGYWPSAWGPLGLVALALLALTVAVLPADAAGRERGRLAALWLLALFVAWCFLSLTWADFPADAWDGSNKTLLYAAGAALFLLRRWSAHALEVALVSFAVGLGALGAGTLAQTLLAGRADRAFADGRLLEPTDYVNGNVALWTLGFWAAVQLAAHPRAAAPWRALLLGCATLLLQLGLLGQSRAWLVLLPVAAAIALLLAPRRLRLVGALLVAGCAAAAATPLLLDVREAALEGSVDAALRRAVAAIALASLVAAAAGAVWALAERRVRPSADAVRRTGLALSIVAALALAAGLAGAAAAVEDPDEWLSSRWDEFAHGTYPEGDRLDGSLASNRYRHWEIAWEEFRERPLAGAGVDNYYAAYLLRRESPQAEPRYPHSWALRLLSQTGLVGTALFVAFAAAAVALALRARRALGPDDGALAAAGVMPFAYWLLHGAVDWFWEIPALAAPALGLLALTAATVTTIPAGTGPRPRLRASGRAVAALVVAACALSLALPWLAHLQQRGGVAVWRSDPGLAYARLERAASLNPIAAEPLLLKGSIALRVDDLGVAADALERVVEREPANWYGWFQRAIAAAAAGDDALAESAIARARLLNPLDPVVADAATAIRERRPVDVRRFDERFQELARQRTGQAGG